MALPFAFVVTISFVPSGEKATWPGVFVNCGVADGFRPSCLDDPGSGKQMIEQDTVALERAPVLGVEDVDQVAADRNADREGPTRGHDLDQRESVAEDGEDGHRVAACVDCVEKVVPLVEREGALRRGVVDDRTGQHTAEPTGRIDAGLGQVPVGRAVVRDHGVAGWIVRLSEHDVVGAAAEESGRRTGGPSEHRRQESRRRKHEPETSKNAHRITPPYLGGHRCSERGPVATVTSVEPV